MLCYLFIYISRFLNNESMRVYENIKTRTPLYGNVKCDFTYDIYLICLFIADI
jgi:hypothetical protein